ncbi:MAG TPA: hypothetical protein VNZ52_12775 [Candidatus Thermoplasmatota archaeon]|nr:hypothetical protein [Candidatus Thermoplasmatota archaeon]
MASSRLVVLLAVLALVPLAAGCTFSQDGTTQSAVSNQKDSFSYAVQGSLSGTHTYTWENSKREAAYNVAVQGSGSVLISIKDPDGKTMLNREVSVTGQTSKAGIAGSGSPGKWTITFTFKNMNGQGAITVNAR